MRVRREEGESGWIPCVGGRYRKLAGSQQPLGLSVGLPRSSERRCDSKRGRMCVLPTCRSRGYKDMSSILETNSALVYEPKCEERGGVAGSQPMSTAVHRSPNKLWRSNSILFNLWCKMTEASFNPDVPRVSIASSSYSCSDAVEAIASSSCVLAGFSAI